MRQEPSSTTKWGSKCCDGNDTYRARLLNKLRLRNNAELSRFAIQHHLIEPCKKIFYKKIRNRLIYRFLPFE